MNENIEVRTIVENDRVSWELLWQGYQTHLRTKVGDSVVEDTWKKLRDENISLTGLVATIGTFRVVGLAHISFSPSSWSSGQLCHIQDLFVGEDIRGRGVGHALMDEIFTTAGKMKCSQVFWHLNRSDFRAKLLFDDYNVGPEGQLVQVNRKLSR